MTPVTVVLRYRAKAVGLGYVTKRATQGNNLERVMFGGAASMNVNYTLLHFCVGELLDTYNTFGDVGPCSSW
ncbi:MAG: hypothetical protein ABTD50_14395 [Polyangiaceae bacterium]